MTKPTVPALPDFPVRGDDFDTFTAKANAHVAALPAWTVAVNSMGDYINDRADQVVNDINDRADQVVNDITALNQQASASSSSAQSSSSIALDSAQIAMAAANFKGIWSDLSGSLSVPSSVFWQSEYWVLMQDVPNVSAVQPGLSSVWERLEAFPIVRTPTAIEPLSGATNVSPTPLLDATGYQSVYSGDARANRQFQVDLATGDFSTPVYTFEGDVDSHTVATALDFNTTHKWRCRDVAASGVVSRWMAVQGFSTGATTVAQPTLTVEGSPSDVPESPTLETSAFAVIGGSDTHLNTDWQVLDDQLAVVWESLADASNKLSISVPGGVLSEDTTYTFRARHRGEVYGASAWRSVVATTLDTFVGNIGAQGTQGFGVGLYKTALPSGFSAMSGTSDPASDNYGNYQYTDGSIMCFVPAFVYRIGSSESPRFADYGANAIDIRGLDEFASVAAANTAGYALHRAFIDGGETKSGFFIDKYIASKDGNTSCKSVKNGVPISLTTTATYTNSNGMVTPDGTCTGILADAVMLSRARGAGFACASVFMYSAIALLSLAHAQAATSTTHCAWYDSNGTTNFPKGCNNGSLADVDDTSVTFTTAGDSGNTNKPLTGSGSPFAKTTHNGQNCGITDVNGAMWEVALGITQPGSSDTDSAQRTTGAQYQRAWTLKESVALSSLKHGWNGTNDAWGNETHLNTLYDETSDLFWWAASGTTYFGNGANQVFSDAVSGRDWLRTSIGISETATGMSATGTSQFGNDFHFAYSMANLFVFVSGGWNSSSSAGVFCRRWDDRRSGTVDTTSWRAAAFGS